MRNQLLCALSLALAATACGPDAKPKTSAPQPVAAASHSLRLDNPIVVPTTYGITLSLDPKLPNFAGAVEIALDVRTAARDFYLNGHGLTVQSAVLDAGGQRFELQTRAEDEEWLHFQSEQVFPAGPAILYVQYTGVLDDQSSYGVFRQQADDSWYVFTQFESNGARRAFPCFDQPDLKVPFQVTLQVPEGLVALNNAPEASRTPMAGGMVSVQFAASKPLPSYLVAFAVGPFDMVEVGMTRSQVPVRVAAPKGRGGETAWVKESTLTILALLEDYVGSGYPYAKLDLVSIPATGSFGAMENPGLITYTETLLLSKDNSLEFRQEYASVGAHEMAHQWFGDLVTNAWWDDIWLNESFATWMAAKTMAKFKPEWRAESGWIDQRERAMGADRLASARVIRQPIVVEDDIEAAFDGITYAKGASVLAMFEAWLGEPVFQKGIQFYLRSKAWQASTATDFVGAMDQGTGQSMSTAFSTFLNTPGTPLVSFVLECKADAAPTLTMSQSRYLPLGSRADANQQYQVPVCVRFPGQGAAVRQCTLLSATSQSLVLDQADACPAWVIPNAGGSGYYRSQLSDAMWTSLFAGAPLSSAELLVLAKDLRALVWAGRAPIERMLALVPIMASSRDDAVVAEAAELANLGALVGTADRARYAKWLAKHFGKRARSLGWTAKPEELPERKQLRAELLSLMIFEGEDQSLRAAGVGIAERWFKDSSKVDADLAGLALQVMAWRGDEAIFDRYLTEIKATSDRSRRSLLLEGLGAASKPELASRALGIMLDEEIGVRESQRTLAGLADTRESRALAFEFLLSNFDALQARYGEEMGSRLARVVGAQCEESQRAAVQSILSDKIAKMDGGAHAAKQAQESFDLCVAARQALTLPAAL